MCDEIGDVLLRALEQRRGDGPSRIGGDAPSFRAVHHAGLQAEEREQHIGG